MKNEPAFPIKNDFDTHKGMTLRDYFAAKAMQGMLAAGNRDAAMTADLAYLYADAMLKERES